MLGIALAFLESALVRGGCLRFTFQAYLNTFELPFTRLPGWKYENL